jgi:GrpB-like predicted nucleotidyltransferase (UPF0157 family)
VGDDDLEERLETVLIGGLEPGRVVLAEPDASWGGRFARGRSRIVRAIGDVAVRIEHIGSTAVPGLAAKPIVDVLVTVADPEAERVYRPQLENAGYQLRVREPGHRMFRTAEHDVHVHVWADTDPEVPRYLAFRDRLRESPADRAAYEQLKLTLAEREWADMNEYAAAKGELVEAILARKAEADRR